MIKQGVISRVKFSCAVILAYLVSLTLQINFIIPTFLFILFLYFRLFRAEKDIRETSLLSLTFLFTIIFSITYFIVSTGGSLLFIPYALIPMLTMILFSELETALLITLISSAVISALTGNNYYMLFLCMISGLTAIILVRNIRRRASVIHAGLLVGLIQALTMFFSENFDLSSPTRYMIVFMNGLGCGVVVIGVLPIFESLFKRVTNISLLELADFNHPLMQRMILEAPGTYHHSLVVGNLSEGACRAVGANALLARIGAYYHDIGKLSKPDYFSENQGISTSKHDFLSPTMSKLIIMNHVKEGVELARKQKLAPALVDFIQQHHGRSLVYYFYRRALEELEEDQQIKEEGFRYAGPKPRTKETAIVLLADSVEAASRALKEPTPEKVQDVVHKVINNKFIDGQLDECDLTLRDLEKISAVFIHILGGIYHSRVNYPEENQNENNHKKPAKEGPHLSGKDKEGGP